MWLILFCKVWWENFDEENGNTIFDIKSSIHWVFKTLCLCLFRSKTVPSKPWLRHQTCTNSRKLNVGFICHWPDVYLKVLDVKWPSSTVPPSSLRDHPGIDPNQPRRPVFPYFFSKYLFSRYSNGLMKLGLENINGFELQYLLFSAWEDINVIVLQNCVKLRSRRQEVWHWWLASAREGNILNKTSTWSK